MYTLKIIRKLPAGTRIFDSVPFEVDEEEHFIELSVDVRVQFHFEGYSSPDSDSVVASVVSEDKTIFVHKNESSYLMNDQGQTVKIIHRV
ncbi:hypothetical protein P13BB106kb_p054 [Pectobacterium phage DU_PP_V]|uniref:Uncharacterized protein n=1 Tax=Pectobacterium phage DU_PP_V TaxID=2041492 RepID=A0A2D2W6W8_9CAUD|nr:hypothetical protein HOS40_gp115 [Pectobacterium phage DU_PP_V]ATS94038.1 hypothetical protein P13BB106kb_p054 [Pectobacterium phage DU_PP_V]